jgi:hypothetical protein
MIASLYDHPDRYDAEHVGHDEDVGFYARAVGEGARVVEVGGGTGRLLPLARDAARWWAVERSAPMVAAWSTREAPVSAEVVHADAMAWTPPEPVDVWLLPFNVANHLPARALRALWRRMAATSAPGARLALDAYVWTPAVASLGGEEMGAVGGLQSTCVDAVARRVVTTTAWPDGLQTSVAWELPTARALRAGLAAAGWRCAVAACPEGGRWRAASPKVWIAAHLDAATRP